MSVLVETTLGDLVFDLYTDERPRCMWLFFIKDISNLLGIFQSICSCDCFYDYLIYWV